MYKLINKQKDVFEFKIEDDDLVIIFNKKGNHTKYQIGNIDILKDSIYYEPFTWKDFILFSNPEINETQIYNGRTKLQSLKGMVIGVNKDIILSLDLTHDKILVHNSDLKNIKSFIKSVSPIKITKKGFFIFRHRDDISRLSILNLETFELKTVSFKEEGWYSERGNGEREEHEAKIFQIIGVWEGKVLLHLGRARLIAVDLETGEESWRIENFLEDVENILPKFRIHITPRTNKRINIVLDNNNSKLYITVLNYMICVDLKVQKYSIYNNFNNNDEIDEVYFKDIKIFGEKITFLGSHESAHFPNMIGIIDIDSKKVDWHEKYEDRLVDYAPIKHKNKLYSLDNKNILSIYEKE